MFDNMDLKINTCVEKLEFWDLKAGDLSLPQLKENLLVTRETMELFRCCDSLFLQHSRSNWLSEGDANIGFFMLVWSRWVGKIAFWLFVWGICGSRKWMWLGGTPLGSLRSISQICWSLDYPWWWSFLLPLTIWSRILNYYVCPLGCKYSCGRDKRVQKFGSQWF